MIAAMVDVNNQLLYEILKTIQSGQAELKAALADQSRQLIKIREEINSLRGDDLRREALQAQMDVRRDRSEHRINLTDA